MRHSLAVFVALSSTVACGDPGDGANDSAEFGILAEGLQSDIGGDPFESWGQLPPLEPPDETAGAYDPGMCSDMVHVALAFARDAQGYIHTTVTGFTAVPWIRYGNGNGEASDRRFAHRPACITTGAAGNPGDFIVVARGSKNPNNYNDRRLFWSSGSVEDALTAPHSDNSQPWQAIDNNTYTNYGSPAIASRPLYNSAPRIVVTLLGDDNKLYAYSKDPGASWSSRVEGPSLPSGWTGSGTPAIVFQGGFLQSFMIFVRASNAWGQVKFFYTFFDGTSFYAYMIMPTPSFTEVPLPSGAPPIHSDPALEFVVWDEHPPGHSDLRANTLYYRSGAQFIQTSTDYLYDFSQNPTKAIAPAGVQPWLTGSPSVVGGVEFESGRHWVMGQDVFKNVWLAESLNDENLIP